MIQMSETINKTAFPKVYACFIMQSKVKQLLIFAAPNSDWKALSTQARIQIEVHQDCICLKIV